MAVPFFDKAFIRLVKSHLFNSAVGENSFSIAYSRLLILDCMTDKDDFGTTFPPTH